MEVRHDPETMSFRTTEKDPATVRRREWEERDRSVTRLVGDLTTHVAHLAKVEAKLAAREVTDKARRGALGGGLFAVAAVIAILGAAGLGGAAVAALSLVWPVWLSALVVGVGLLALAGIVALIARAKLRRAIPPVPDETMERAREDVAAMHGRMEARR
ncbi:phage holin family protein [Glycomyces sp. L485]|uniref:phage holin family protein n=1 Tax=Glycomyces sp. L485 TaxID=2909235 RepID=UPI001F4AED7C|nr:phage holin family protein [Glycomyces sp. L485]MCH7231919.1 phage holin family protein [Glycomyces sp. L485]